MLNGNGVSETVGDCAHRCGEGVFVCRGEETGACHMISEKQKPMCEKRRRRRGKKRLGEGATEKGGGLWVGMASPCCRCGRWWPVISVLSLSDRPDNQ